MDEGHNFQHYEYERYSIDIIEHNDAEECIYIITDADRARIIWDKLKIKPRAFIVIGGVDWNKDLSPWPAPRCFINGEDFGGGGDVFLRKLTGDIMPLAESLIDAIPARRIIAGYSLAGLFSLYAAYRCDVFDGIASVSGSLWYDGWTDFICKACPVNPNIDIYVSLGDREERARSSRLALVWTGTRKTVETLRRYGVNLFFEWNKGNHFFETEGRVAKGIDWLMALRGKGT